MRKVLTFIMAFLIGSFLTCNKNDPDLPTCDDMIQNQGETGIDCGGPCDPCFECLTEYCALLSGATSDENSSETWESADGLFKWIIKSKGELTEYWYPHPDDPLLISSGIWSFDDPTNPLLLNVIYKTKRDPYPDVVNYALYIFTQDTLYVGDGGFGVVLIRQN